MTCPSCGAVRLSPLSGTCELCGFSDAAVALQPDDRVVALARAELSHEFDLVDPVGRGVRSAVFIARERSSGREVMLKVRTRLVDRRDADTLFRAALAAQITFDHPHIVPVLRVGVTDSLCWFTRENIRATPLSDVLRQGTQLDVRTCRRMATQLCSALDYLHRRGVIHGALKPANILLDAQGWVHLCDPAVPTERPSVRRTPVGAFADTRSPAADQRALAAVLHECLTGVTPERGHAALLKSATIPAPIGAAIVRALSPEPRDRFPSLTDFVWALENTAPTPTARTAAGRKSTEVLFVPDWQAPGERATLPKLLGKLALGAAAIAGAWFGFPALMRTVRPAPSYSPVSAPAAAATRPPTQPPVAAPNPRQSPAEPAAPTRTAPARSAAAPAATPAATAVLSINSTPWGLVTIDGQAVGNTPRRNHAVTAGTHVVRITRDGFTPYERTLRFASGDTVRLTNIVLVPRDR